VRAIDATVLMMLRREMSKTGERESPSKADIEVMEAL
jgi:hypothetical protein